MIGTPVDLALVILAVSAVVAVCRWSYNYGVEEGWRRAGAWADDNLDVIDLEREQ